MTFVEPKGFIDDEGEFPDADGALIKAYDDVVLLRSIETFDPINQKLVDAPTGAVGTVLWFYLGPPIVANLEVKLAPGFGMGYEELAQVKLHRRAEDKLSSDGARA
jgi:hypothetical protein